MESNTVNPKPSPEGFWDSNKMMIKSVVIFFLVLFLLIPTIFIQELITERQGRQAEAVREVSSKWASAQTITGPVISVPYMETVKFSDGTTSKEKKNIFFLPSKLKIQSKVDPEERHRGIYTVIVYTTSIKMNGSFSGFDIKELGVAPQDVLWNEAAVFVDISDVRGLKDATTLNWQGSQIELVPAKFSNAQFKTSLSGVLPLNDTTISSGGDFTMSIVLKGSDTLQFIPAGKETSVEVSSTWADPSFSGNCLPDERKVSDSGFSAKWNLLYLNRSYPQQWKDAVYDLGKSSFGVNLLVPVDGYQKTMRSVKYAILCILLSFVAFFLVELIYNKAIHVLQYVLVGVALCIFYTLLLSVSEYMTFNLAYLISSVATIALIAWYVKSVIRSTGITLFITSTLLVLYGFVFILIQSQDYALLMGSVGLFIITGLIMYFSRKVKWK